jgi:hypothetical protein
MPAGVSADRTRQTPKKFASQIRNPTLQLWLQPMVSHTLSFIFKILNAEKFEVVKHTCI